MSTITVNTPAQVAEPRGARWAGAAFARLLKWMQTSAANRDVQRVVFSRQAEAARVRQYAQEVMGQDPRFAADLFAAADRHERGG
jgi:hypothetical protein